MFARSGAIRTALLLTVCALPALPAQGRTAEQLRLDGVVPTVCVLRITDVASNIDIRRGLENQPIATVGEKCNDQDGYRIVLRSSNGGTLAGNGRRIGYTVSYGPLQGTKLSQPRAVVSREPQTDWQTRTLSITVPPVKEEDDGVWDAVTLSIEAR